MIIEQAPPPRDEGWGRAGRMSERRMVEQTPRAPIPIVAVTGSVGKTTTATILDRLVRGVGWHTLTWLDEGVAVDGYPEAGELLPWREGVQRLLRGELQLAIQELPAATVQAVGLPERAYLAAIVLNLAMNDPGQIGTERWQRQAAANRRVAAAVHPDGALILNADDRDVADLAGASAAPVVLWAQRRRSPPLARHLKRGGAGVHVADDRIVWERAGERVAVVELAAMPLTRGGPAPIQIQNCLPALAAALALGLPPARLGAALTRLEETPRLVERLVTLRRGLHCPTIVAEARCPLAFRGLARLMGRVAGGSGRIVGTVAWPAALDESEAREVARVLAKLYSLVFLHGPGSERAADLVREARPPDRLPTFCVPVEAEIEALRRLVNVLGVGDRALLIGDQAPASLALFESFRS